MSLEKVAAGFARQVQEIESKLAALKEVTELVEKLKTVIAPYPDLRDIVLAELQPPATKANRKKVLNVYGRVCAYFLSNANTPHTITEIAAALGYSSSAIRTAVYLRNPDHFERVDKDGQQWRWRLTEKKFAEINKSGT